MIPTAKDTNDVGAWPVNGLRCLIIVYNNSFAINVVILNV